MIAIISRLIKTKMRFVVLSLTSLLVTSLCSVSAIAQEVNLMRLSDFYAGDSTLRLAGNSATQSISIPLAPGVTVDSAKVTIKAVSSIALIEKRSILNIRFNNATIGQIALNSQRPNFSADVAIPASLWRKEFNALTFTVSQHSGTCASSNAPELWTEVDLYHSFLSVDTSINTENLTLQMLSDYFHPGIGSQRQASIFTVQDDSELTSIEQSVLPALAQGLALREQYRAISFDYQTIPAQADDKLFQAGQFSESNELYSISSWYQQQPNKDRVHLLVGSKAALSGLVSEQVYNAISGPFLMLEQTPEIIVENELLVPSQVRLIVSGITGEDLVQAASSLAHMDDALNPNSQLSILTSSESPLMRSFQQNVDLHPEQTYSFNQLGQGNINFSGDAAFFSAVQVRLPADFYVAENSNMKLELDFGYGAGFGLGSIMNIAINGELVHSLALNNINGNSYRGYLLKIPARYFKGGINNLEFFVNQNTTPVPGECANVPGRYLRFYISDSSQITIPEAVHLARQPDFKLLAETGYPFARFHLPDLSTVYITQPEMRSAALTLIGKIAQSAKSFIPDLNLASTLPESLSTNALVLARPKDLNDEMFNNVSASLASTKKWPYRLQNELYNRVSKGEANSNLKPISATSFTQQNSSLGEMAVFLGFKNPLSVKTGTLMVLAADSSKILTQRVNELVDGGLWGQLSGDFFAWQQEDKAELIMQVADSFEIGKADPMMEARAWLSNNPWYWMLGAIASVLLGSMAAYFLLKRRHRKLKEEW